jgi:hypothetical protein
LLIEYHIFLLRSILFLKSTRDTWVLFLVEWDWEANRKVNYQLINFSGRYNRPTTQITIKDLNAPLARCNTQQLIPHSTISTNCLSTPCAHFQKIYGGNLKVSNNLFLGIPWTLKRKGRDNGLYTEKKYTITTKNLAIGRVSTVTSTVDMHPISHVSFWHVANCINTPIGRVYLIHGPNYTRVQLDACNNTRVHFFFKNKYILKNILNIY